MSKKILQIIWLIIIVLFVALQVYNYSRGNYYDLLATAIIVIILLLMLAVYYFIIIK